MAKIIKIEGDTVTVGMDDFTTARFDKSACAGFTPAIGQEVDVFKAGDSSILSLRSSAQVILPDSNHKVNKVAYILLCFFFGTIGLHKFYAGHWILGIIYICLCWTLIPSLIAFIELIIAICKPADSHGDFIA